MKKLSILLMGAFFVMSVGVSANATTFTMSPTQLQALYEISPNLSNDSTYLNPVQEIPNGAKYIGNIGEISEELCYGLIRIGANGENINSLGMGNLSGYGTYALYIENVNENPWEFSLYIEDGDSRYQSEWTEIAVGSGKTLVLDLTDLSINLNAITSIGFNIAGNVPLGTDEDDYTFEAKVSPVPEPCTLLLVGSGLLLGLYRRNRKQ
jgi:hypothetical protein